jgi:hypothetical protein
MNGRRRFYVGGHTIELPPQAVGLEKWPDPPPQDPDFETVVTIIDEANGSITVDRRRKAGR